MQYYLFIYFLLLILSFSKRNNYGKRTQEKMYIECQEFKVPTIPSVPKNARFKSVSLNEITRLKQLASSYRYYIFY